MPRRWTPLYLVPTLCLLGFIFTGQAWGAEAPEPITHGGEGGPSRIAVLEFSHGDDITARQRAYVTDLARTAALKLPPTAWFVITRENLLEALPPGVALADCEGDCEIETGRNVGAHYVITGEILTFGAAFKVSMKLFDTRNARLINASWASSAGSVGLEEAVVEGATRLLAPLRAGRQSSVQSLVQPSTPTAKPSPGRWRPLQRAHRWIQPHIREKHRREINGAWLLTQREAIKLGGSRGLARVDAFIDHYAAHPLGNHRRPEADALRRQLSMRGTEGPRRAPMEYLLVGDWHFLPRPDLSDAFYLWYGDQADPAVEIVRDANGWWRLRTGSGSWTVYAAGQQRRRAFDDQPWNRTLPVAVPVTSPLSVAFFGRYGQTVVQLSPSGITVELADGGRILARAGDPALTFIDAKDKRAHFRAGKVEPTDH